MISQLVLAGLGLIPGIKEQINLLTDTNTSIDPVWKNRVETTAPTATPVNAYIIEDEEGASVENPGLTDIETLQILVFQAVTLGQHFERPNGDNYEVTHVEKLPGSSKEMYLASARKIITGQRT